MQNPPSKPLDPPGIKGVILAGGRGTRLRSLGDVLPKCLLPIFDQPLLLRQIEQCARAGVDEIFVSVAAKFAPLVSTVLEHYQSPVKVTCVPEAVPLGPVGGLLSMIDALEGGGVLMLLGDEYIQDMSALKDVTHASLKNPEDLVLGVVAGSHPSQISCNAVLDDQGRVRQLVEKPAPREIIGDVRWCGVAAFPAGALRKIPLSETRIDTHVGDAFTTLIDQGYVARPAWIREIHLNLNTLDVALVASLLESGVTDQGTTLEEILAHTRDLLRRALPHMHRD